MPPEIEDLNDYQLEEWPTTPEGEERQAREVVKHYKTLFAHPLVESITWWNFTDDAWLGAPAGLVRRDNSSKPAYEELQKLIKKEWWTEPKSMATNEAGKVEVTGFLGDHEITLGDKKGHFVLDKDGTPAKIVF
jgi:hypothetical protein